MTAWRAPGHVGVMAWFCAGGMASGAKARAGGRAWQGLAQAGLGETDGRILVVMPPASSPVNQGPGEG